MSQEIEIEYKNLLTKTEFDRIITQFQLNHENPFTQTNYYFDTTDFQLKAHHSALRIRTRPDQPHAEMTLKTPKEGQLLETTTQLTLEQAQSFLYRKIIEPTTEIAQQLQKIGLEQKQIKPLTLFAELTTTRREKQLPQGTIVLDHSWYGTQEDFELEVESTTAADGQALFQAILQQCKIPHRKTPHKIKRAQQALQQ
ncbi:CYTH domain-containing protein [Dolosigranulum savutiense]|uniref:CYTH domain-containing protein n=1 Tax=Dolosigranulum savutiense TaxID=3110288 RepID=A0AB74U1Q8_9LACT